MRPALWVQTRLFQPVSQATRAIVRDLDVHLTLHLPGSCSLAVAAWARIPNTLVRHFGGVFGCRWVRGRSRWSFVRGVVELKSCTKPRLPLSKNPQWCQGGAKFGTYRKLKSPPFCIRLHLRTFACSCIVIPRKRHVGEDKVERLEIRHDFTTIPAKAP